MKSRSHTIQLCVLLAGFLTSTPGARAALVVGNMTSVNNAGGGTGNTVIRVAAPFTLDSTFVPADLASVTVRLQALADPLTASLALWSDSSSLPGNQLVDLGTNNIAEVIQDNYVFTPVSSFTLQPGTNYWLVLRKTSAQGIVNWRGTDGGHAIDPGSDPAANIPAGVSFLSLDNGATWTVHSPEKLFAVYSVPEPATLSILILGALFATRRQH